MQRMQLPRVSVCLEHWYKMAHSRPKTKIKPQKQRNSYRRKARNKPSGLEPFVLVEANAILMHLTCCGHSGGIIFFFPFLRLRQPAMTSQLLSAWRKLLRTCKEVEGTILPVANTANLISDANGIYSKRPNSGWTLFYSIFHFFLLIQRYIVLFCFFFW